ncbi:hypothetical protein E0H88_00575 [Acinetobacter sp. ANC 4216]|nr:hypothetical protein E0H88_00575 [Acinetobacter sp. ANC 4216]
MVTQLMALVRLFFKSISYPRFGLSNVSIDDISMKSIVVEVLNKIGEESEFKKNFMQDIIENHLD